MCLTLESRVKTHENQSEKYPHMSKRVSRFSKRGVYKKAILKYKSTFSAFQNLKKMFPQIESEYQMTRSINKTNLHLNTLQ